MMAAEDRLRIGQVARAARVNVQTLRPCVTMNAKDCCRRRAGRSRDTAWTARISC